MLRIRTLNKLDLAFAVRLSNQEGWSTPRGDLERILRLDPYGSFIALESDKKLGIATTVSYGKTLGWIGNVIVDKQHRGRNIGRALVLHALHYLQTRGVRCIGLYCFNQNISFYENLGFVVHNKFLRLKRKGPVVKGRLHEKPFNRQLLSRIFAIDKKVFGADRSRLIRIALADGWASCLGTVNNQAHASYLFLKDYGSMFDLGPWVSLNSRREETGILHQAIATTRGKPIEVSCLSKNARALSLFRRNGFRVIGEGVRMYYGRRARIGNDGPQFALGFKDKG
jgi:ribosomal protein S18 acetylase RimI-like enzyme